MKILFVLEYYSPHLGGAETLFRNLCEGLVLRQHKVAVVTSHLPDTELREQLNGVRIYRVKTPNHNKRYWFTFLAIPTVLKLAKEADVISTTTYNGAFPAWLASKIYRKPCVITVHEIIGSLWGELQGMSKLSAWSHRFLEWLIIKLVFSQYVGVSNYIANAIRAYGKEATTVYNGVDYDNFNSKNVARHSIRRSLELGDCFVYLYYGRPGLSKGVEYLVRAVRLVANKIPDSKLLLILANEPSDGYRMVINMIKILGIVNNVVLIASVPYIALPNYIAAVDCVVIPSVSEGFGFSAAEACAMGKPVVASNVASLPEIVSGRYVLVEPRNPKAIAKGVCRVYEGEVTVSEPKRFEWVDCIGDYEEIYRELVR